MNLANHFIYLSWGRRPLPPALFGSSGCLLGVWCRHFDISGNHFGTSGASYLAPWDHPGRPWEQQDGLEMVVYRILFDWRVILRPVHIRFLSSRRLKFHFVSGLFTGHFVIDFWIEISTSGTSKSRFSHGRYCTNRLFMEIVFNAFRDRFL